MTPTQAKDERENVGINKASQSTFLLLPYYNICLIIHLMYIYLLTRTACDGTFDSQASAALKPTLTQAGGRPGC